MTEVIRPHPKEIDAPYKRVNEDDALSDIPSDAGAGAGSGRFRLFGRILGSIISIAINILILIAINFLYTHIPFLTDDFPKWLPYANVSLIANIVLQFLLLFLGDTIFKPLLDAGANAVTIGSLIAFWVIFPVDFDIIIWLGPLEDILRIATAILILIVVVVMIANIVTFFGKILDPE